MHLPNFMVEEEVRGGTLITLQGRTLPRRTETLAAMRRADRHHGPVAEGLWRTLKETLERP